MRAASGGPDARQLLRVDIAACYSDPGNGAELPVRLDRSGEPVRVDIDGSRTEDDCATSVDVVLDEPLGSRAVRVADTDTTYERCDRGGEFSLSGDVELEVLCER